MASATPLLQRELSGQWRDLRHRSERKSIHSSLFKPRARGRSAAGDDHVVVRVQNSDYRTRDKLVAGCSEFQDRRNFLRADKPAAGVIAKIRERVRVILPTQFALPNSVTGTTESGAGTRSGAIFRQRTALVKGEDPRERTAQRNASLTIDSRNPGSPDPLEGSRPAVGCRGMAFARVTPHQ